MLDSVAPPPAPAPATWWATALELVKIAGPTTVLLGAAFYWMTQVADRDHQKVIQTNEKVATSVVAASGMLLSLTDSTGRANAELLNLVRVMCVNQATDVQQRRDCLQPARAVARTEATNER